VVAFKQLQHKSYNTAYAYYVW